MAGESSFDPPCHGKPETATTGREAAILFALAALQFIALVDFMIVMPLGPQLLDDLSIDARRFSWVVSAYTLTAGLAGFLAAPWLDRVPRRPAYLFLAIGMLVGTVACGLATSFPLLLAARSVTQTQLPAVFISGGLLTLLTTPLTGRLIDRFGALPLFRGVVPMSAGMMLVLTHLPAVGILGAAPVTAVLMATNAGRMVTAMALITNSIEPRRRGGFMSVNSSVQHVASGLGTTCSGLIVGGGAGEPLRHFGMVGILAAAITLASLWLAARIRPVA